TGGVMHCATDWQDYAKHMMRILSQHVGFKNQIALNQFADNAANQLRPVTKFEQRGIRLKHDVWDLLFEKLPTS
ncbi:MAG: tRNA (guanine-N(7)-)-methyltransferase, partial [uncultured bacterium]